MTPTYLVDNNVLSFFFNAGRKGDLTAICGALSLAVVEEVHDEALRHKTRGDEYRAWHGRGLVSVRQIPLGGVGARCLGRLYKNTTGKDLGEYASIALAVEDPSLVLVTNDKVGHWIGAREVLGERVLRFWAFLRRAQAAAGLDAAAIRSLVANNGQSLTSDEPLWLAEWLDGLG